MTTRGGTDRVEFFRGADRLWYFRRVSANNEIVATSEGYQNRADAIKIATDVFHDVGLYIQLDNGWEEVKTVSENETPEDEAELEAQTNTEGEEVEGEPEFLPEPEQEDAPADAEEGPEPSEPPVEA